MTAWKGEPEAIQAIKEDGLSCNDKIQFPSVLLTHFMSISKVLHSFLVLSFPFGKPG